MPADYFDYTRVITGKLISLVTFNQENIFKPANRPADLRAFLQDEASIAKYLESERIERLELSRTCEELNRLERIETLKGIDEILAQTSSERVIAFGLGGRRILDPHGFDPPSILILFHSFKIILCEKIRQEIAVLLKNIKLGIIR